MNPMIKKLPEDEIRKLNIKIFELENRLKKMELIVLRLQSTQFKHAKQLKYIE